MKLYLKKVKKSNWVSNFKCLGVEIKWFGLLPRESDSFYYDIVLKISSNDSIVIGGCYFQKNEGKCNCSFYLLPEFRRKGFATELIKNIAQNVKNVRFSVSKYNSISIQFFKSMTEQNILTFSSIDQHLYYSKRMIS
jgi:GNAT superfamily N-acetyltransferase